MYCVEHGIDKGNDDDHLSSSVRVLIIDGMAVVNKVDMKSLQSCKDFADAFVQRISSTVRGYTEVRLVFDRYIQQSLKSRTRDKRTYGVQIR